MLIDSKLEDGLLREVPIVNVIMTLWKTGKTVRDALLLNKLKAFLEDVASVPVEKRTEIIISLENEETAEDVGEKLFNILDHFESSKKASLLGKAFALLASQTITPEEFWQLSHILSSLLLSDIFALKTWEFLDLNQVEHRRRQLYLSTGIGWFTLDLSSTGFQWQEQLCRIFSEHLL